MVESRHTGQALLFFSSLPDLKKLCVITLTVKKAAKTPTSSGPATGKFQLQITKCRELIFTEAGILASPSVDDYDTINIIVQLEDFAVDPQASWLFYSNPYAVVSEHFIQDRWCYVLPRAATPIDAVQCEPFRIALMEVINRHSGKGLWK
ncbi:uncharacterized protein LOC118417449 [Branchiostoma floridae]|uniref:Uncharacterized protein LOC118417449 n=1 Tax=Branchiostoma floridae TaxID=7739 RepID=A0A9J7MU66_BRAFL|nr:uncharacterized protein LOC118417449 [Branchiostoma floridae]